MPSIQTFQPINVSDPSQFTVTIPTAQSISNSLNVGRTTPCGIVVDSVLSDVTLNVSVNIVTEGAWHAMYDGEAVPARYAIVLPIIAPSTKVYIPLSPVVFTGVQNLRFEISGGGVAASDAAIEVALRPF